MPENMPFDIPTTSFVGTHNVGGFPPMNPASFPILAPWYGMLSCFDKDGKLSLEKYNRLMDSWGMMRAETIYSP